MLSSQLHLAIMLFLFLGLAEELVIHQFFDGAALIGILLQTLVQEVTCLP